MAGGAVILPVQLRAAQSSDYDFARRVHHVGMRWISERLFGWDDAAEDAKFQRQFVLTETRVIVLGREDVGYVQTAEEADAFFLKELHVAAAFQRRGIGTEVLRKLCAEAERIGKPITVAVVKFNPARELYERNGFRMTHEDTHKIYLRRGPPAGLPAA
jgi:GNAT superfamily N-acetyltransferase